MYTQVDCKARFLLLLLVVLLVAAAVSTGCTSGGKTDDPEKVKAELAAVERRLIMAVQRKDLATLNEIWDDDYLGTAPNGRVVSKADLMAAVSDNVIQIQTLEPDELYVRLFDDVAVMTGKAAVKATVVNEAVDSNVRGTGIFIRRDGRWKIAGVHVGPNIPDGPIGPVFNK
jgi:ketosteroid isomerase-like protein